MAVEIRGRSRSTCGAAIARFSDWFQYAAALAGCVGFIRRGVKDVDRIVNIGEALDIGVIWDGFDIVKALSRIVSY
ncbi:MAG: hypothetical protein IKW80_10625 [Thermoguttaceae bacterium]|nr:hypothetical protein [Thermoguttaceae bacterium]